MKPRDRKLAILRQLSQMSEPVSLPDLIDTLQDDFKERSVRRWLNQFVEEGLVKRTGRKRGTKYQVVQSQGQHNHAVSSCFSSESLEAIRRVQRPLYERKPKAYAEEWLDSYQPNKTFLFNEFIRNQLYEAGVRETNNDPAGTYARQIFNRLLIDLSFNSSRLEGNTYSKLDTERLILKGTSPDGKLDQEKVMILNHKEAIRYLVENAPRLAVNEPTIFTLHYLLADGLVESEYAGRVRDHWVRISGSTYIPFEDSRRLKFQLEKVIAKAAQIKDPFEQSLFLLVHLSYLQAFTDVNKRTARLAANIPLIVGNLVPLSFNDIEKDDYIAAIVAVYELQDVRPIADLYIFSYIRTCAAYDSTVKALGFDEVRVRYRQERREVIREIILKKLAGKQLEDFARSEALKKVPDKARESFLEDIFEDLRQIDESRLVGLGVTSDQLNEWLQLNQ